MPSKRVVLPERWLQDEFQLSTVAGPGQPGKRIIYKCKKCDIEPVNNLTAARTHAKRQGHRARFQQADTAQSGPPIAGASGSQSVSSFDNLPDAASAENGNTLGGDEWASQEPVDGWLYSPTPFSPGDFTLQRSAVAPHKHSFDQARHIDPHETQVEDAPSEVEEYEVPEYLPQSENDSASQSAALSYRSTDDLSSSADESQRDSASSGASDYEADGGAHDDTGPRTTPRERRKNRYAPYPNLTWCILDIMLNLPRHPISDELLKIILWALKMLGVKNVPSLKALRQFQTRLRQASLFKKGQSHVSVLGNHFTSNSILQSIRLDMANPEVRNRLVFYPEEPVDGLSELRHSWKWFLGLPDNRLTPMWAARGVHFYVGEAACLESGDIVIPLRWYMRRGEMYMFYFSTRVTPEGRFEVDTTCRCKRPASDLRYNLPELLKHHPDICFKDTPTPLELGHPLQANEWRSRANGRPCYVYFILLGGDDVSGNRSKTWNKHWCFYFCAAGLPLACMNQEYFVHFVSTSQHAGPVEQVAVITGELRCDLMMALIRVYYHH
ncbi:hypothetical protein C8Q78DRAFT_1194548 [Trametes maxima]|nr:hypothetical protein C8Q78DRAFT_1194548 [Trametes maxima]